MEISTAISGRVGPQRAGVRSARPRAKARAAVSTILAMQSAGATDAAPPTSGSASCSRLPAAHTSSAASWGSKHPRDGARAVQSGGCERPSSVTGVDSSQQGAVAEWAEPSGRSRVGDGVGGGVRLARKPRVPAARSSGGRAAAARPASPSPRAVPAAAAALLAAEWSLFAEPGVPPGPQDGAWSVEISRAISGRAGPPTRARNARGRARDAGRAAEPEASVSAGGGRSASQPRPRLLGGRHERALAGSEIRADHLGAIIYRLRRPLPRPGRRGTSRRWRVGAADAPYRRRGRPARDRRLHRTWMRPLACLALSHLVWGASPT